MDWLYSDLDASDVREGDEEEESARIWEPAGKVAANSDARAEEAAATYL